MQELKTEASGNPEESEELDKLPPPIPVPKNTGEKVTLDIDLNEDETLSPPLATTSTEAKDKITSDKEEKIDTNPPPIPVQKKSESKIPENKIDEKDIENLPPPVPTHKKSDSKPLLQNEDIENSSETPTDNKADSKPAVEDEVNHEPNDTSTTPAVPTETTSEKDQAKTLNTGSKPVIKGIADLKQEEGMLTKRKSGILKMAHKYKSGNQLRSNTLKNGELNPLVKANTTLRNFGDKTTLRSFRFKVSSQTLASDVSGIHDISNSEEAKKYPFKGKWESYEVELDTFMSELNLTTKFAKLAVTYGGDVTNQLKIKQSGESGEQFVITEINDRRKIKYAVNVGDSFKSVNELEEELECTSRWGEDALELIIEEDNKVTKELTVVKRKINLEEGTLIETRKVGDKDETSRTYTRKIKTKKKT